MSQDKQTGPATPAAPTLPPPAYVHLKVHSAYSLLEGALPMGAERADHTHTDFKVWVAPQQGANT